MATSTHQLAAARWQPQILVCDPWWPVWGRTRRTLVELRDAGMSVTPVGDGRAALIEAQQTRYRVAVVELACGVRGGLHAVQIVTRLLELNPAPRVLLASAAGTVDSGRMWVNLELVPVVPTAELVGVVCAVLDGGAVT